MGNRRIGRETALQFLFSRDLNDNITPEDPENFFALRIAKQSSFTAQDIREDQDRPENPGPGNDSLALHAGMGSDTIRKILATTDIPGLIKELEKILRTTSSKKLQKKITKRLKIAKDFSTNQVFAQKLVHGILEHQAEIDKQLSEHLENFTLTRVSTVDRNVLRLAVYEMFHCDDVPPIIAINEAIELAKRFGTEESGRFVNGILDRLKDQLTRSLRE